MLFLNSLPLGIPSLSKICIGWFFFSSHFKLSNYHSNWNWYIVVFALEHKSGKKFAWQKKTDLVWENQPNSGIILYIVMIYGVYHYTLLYSVFILSRREISQQKGFQNYPENRKTKSKKCQIVHKTFHSKQM